MEDGGTRETNPPGNVGVSAADKARSELCELYELSDRLSNLLRQSQKPTVLQRLQPVQGPWKRLVLGVSRMFSRW